MLEHHNIDSVYDYIRNYFRIHIYSKPLSQANLPNYVKMDYDINFILINDLEYTLLSKHDSDFSLSRLASVIEAIKKDSPNIKNILFHFSDLSALQRKSLISANIPFVVPNRFLYLPDVFLIINERNKKQQIDKDKLSPGAINVLFYLLVSKETNIAKPFIQKQLEVNKMYMSRAIQELLEFEYIEISKFNRNSKISLARPKVEIWNEASKHFSNPIIKKVNISAESISQLPEFFIETGTLALSKQSNLYEDELCYAIENTLWLSIESQYELAYPGSYRNIEVEIWKSKIPTYQGKINPLALYYSLQENASERVHYAFDELLTDILGGDVKW